MNSIPPRRVEVVANHQVNIRNLQRANTIDTKIFYRGSLASRQASPRYSDTPT